MADEDDSTIMNDDGTDNDTNDNNNSDDDFLNELLLDIDDLEDDKDTSDDDKDKDKDKDKGKDKGKGSNDDTKNLTSEITTLKDQVSKLWTDKNDLKKALHQARQKSKKSDKSQDDTPLSDDQLMKIMKENKDDPKTILDVVKHLAATEAKKESGKMVTDAAMKTKKSELDTRLYTMYPALKDDTSKLREVVDSTINTYNLSGHPIGEAAAMGIHLLTVLPDLLQAAEEKGLKGKNKSDADKNRKDSISNNRRVSGKSGITKKDGLSETQTQTGKQLNLTPSQRKIFSSLSGKKGAASISVNE